MHRLFYVSVIAKGLNGLLEIVIGIASFLITEPTLISWVSFLTREELLEESNDIFANYLVHAVQNYSIDMQHFVAIYLLLHGVVKLFLVAGLLQKRLWAYPTAMIIFGLFALYQSIEYLLHPHPSLIVLTVIDLLVIALTYKEYQILKRPLTPTN